MIKMFGWEGKVEKQVNVKREEELAYVIKKHLWNLINLSLK